MSKNYLKGKVDWKDKIERLENGDVTPKDIKMAKGVISGTIETNKIRRRIESGEKRIKWELRM